MWDVIAHPRYNFNGGSNKPPLKLESMIIYTLQVWLVLLMP